MKIVYYMDKEVKKRKEKKINIICNPQNSTAINNVETLIEPVVLSRTSLIVYSDQKKASLQTLQPVHTGEQIREK